MTNEAYGRDGSFDPLTAFVAGSVLGAALALMLAPRRKAPFTKELERAAKRTRKDFFKSGKRVRGTTNDIVEEGAKVLSGMRKDLEGFLDEARESLRDVVNDELKALEKGVNRRRSRLFG